MKAVLIIIAALWLCGCARSAMVPLASGDSLYFARRYGAVAVECVRWDGSYCAVQVATPAQSTIPNPLNLFADIPPL